MKKTKDGLKKFARFFGNPEQEDGYWIVTLGIIASLSLVACALCYLAAPVPIDGLGGFLPDSSKAGKALTWFNMVYATGLVCYALAAAPITVVFAVRCYRLNPILIVMASVWLELSFVLELVNNLPIAARFLLPPTATPAGLSDKALTYLSQVNALNYYALDVPGFMLAYIGLAIIAAVVYRRSRSIAIVTAASFAMLLANIPFLWLEPKILASIFMGLAILAFAGFPLVMVKLSIKEKDSKS